MPMNAMARPILSCLATAVVHDRPGKDLYLYLVYQYLGTLAYTLAGM